MTSDGDVGSSDGGCRAQAPAAVARRPAPAVRVASAIPVASRCRRSSATRAAHAEPRRVAGYTEASRGCKHRCRHCPIVPVYDGRFRVVPVDVVMADVARRSPPAREHITFGDPDFFNGPRHADAIVEPLARAISRALSYDVTIKVEHLLAHAGPRAVAARRPAACSSPARSNRLTIDVLARLEKGHTRADFERAVGLCRDAGLVLSPTFVAFTPWTTRKAIASCSQTIDRLALVEQVAPIQLAIRLLVTEGSRLLELREMQALVRTVRRAQR